jgi:hypothetical protein
MNLFLEDLINLLINKNLKPHNVIRIPNLKIFLRNNSKVDSLH